MPDPSLKPLLDRLKGSPQPITPAAYLRRRTPRPAQVVVMFGDSLTEGILSANFVVPLQKQFGPLGYEFINAGVSADLAYNLLRRSPEVIACCPDRIVLLVGANDAQASHSTLMGEQFMRMKDLPRRPDEEWFCQNLRAMLEGLKSSLPVCRIALLSLGLYGEDLSSPANSTMARFSEHICQIAAEGGVDYLPLHEHFSAHLQDLPRLRALHFDDGHMLRMLYTAMLRRALLRQSFDRIAAAHRFHLLSDGLHFNERAAGLVVDLVGAWIRNG
jgi:acyl-CoA thioesterase I